MILVAGTEALGASARSNEPDFEKPLLRPVAHCAMRNDSLEITAANEKPLTVGDSGDRASASLEETLGVMEHLVQSGRVGDRALGARWLPARHRLGRAARRSSIRSGIGGRPPPIASDRRPVVDHAGSPNLMARAAGARSSARRGRTRCRYAAVSTPPARGTPRERCFTSSTPLTKSDRSRSQQNPPGFLLRDPIVRAVP
jgi:hypothetical protein